MNIVAWLGVVSGIITILAFVFAVWVWIRSDTKIRERENVIQSVYDITGKILWDMQSIPLEDAGARLRHAESSLGSLSALRIMTGKFARSANDFRETEIGNLLERGIIMEHFLNPRN